MTNLETIPLGRKIIIVLVILSETPGFEADYIQVSLHDWNELCCYLLITQLDLTIAGQHVRVSEEVERGYMRPVKKNGPSLRDVNIEELWLILSERPLDRFRRIINFDILGTNDKDQEVLDKSHVLNRFSRDPVL